jgi:hypothetical protein
MKNLFDEAMNGIGEKVALQEIRKVLRGKLPEKDKLEAVVVIIHTYEDYAERQELEAERRAIEADEAEMRREKINEMFENMAPDFDKLTSAIRKDDGK